MYFKCLKLLVCQQLLFMRFADLEAGIVQFTPNTSCHNAYCQHYFGDQTPNDSRVCYSLLSVGQKMNSHQILSQKYQPVLYLYSILRPDWFGAHHLDFGSLFWSIRGWSFAHSAKKKKACDLFWKWVFVIWLLTESVWIKCNTLFISEGGSGANVCTTTKTFFCFHETFSSPPCVKYSRLIYLKRHKILILTFIFPRGAVLALCFPGNWCLTLCPVSLTFSFDFERLVYW